MQPATDASLVFAATRARDPDAVQEIVRRYGELIYSVAQRVTGDDDRAVDVLRESVLLLACEPGRVRGELASWLHRVAVERALAKPRADQSGPRRDPAEEPTWDEFAPLLDLSLSKIGRRHRLMIIQHYFQRHTQDELAAVLQVTQPVVARRLRRALEVLRSKLVQTGGGCSLAHLMMLLARHGASYAPPEIVDEAALSAAHELSLSPRRRSGWVGTVAVWAMIAGLLIAVAVSYSSTRGAASAQPPVVPAKQ